MRSSPINHLKQPLVDESPYRNVLQRRSAKKDTHSPDTVSINFNDIEYWKQKAMGFQSQNLALSEELLLLNRRMSQQSELEEKIQVLLAQNSHLADENDNLIQLIQHKKTQIDHWRSKFQGKSNQTQLAEVEKKKIYDHLNIKDQEHQIQIDKLVAEISKLHDQMEQFQNLKQIQIASIKNKYQNDAINQIQNLRRSQYGSSQLQELNIRKLKDSLEEKNFEIENLRRQSKINNQRLAGEISFLKNQFKKLQLQKQHQIDLIKTENQNAKNNLIRANKKNQDQMKNIHQIKVKRLLYQIEEKKHQIQDYQGKSKKGGKENQIQLNQIVNQKNKLRLEIKQDNNASQRRISQITLFYQKQAQQLRTNRDQRQKALIEIYQNQIKSLKEVIELKQQEIKRLLSLNQDLKRNQTIKINAIKENNSQLKKKIQQIVLHYQRQIQLMKIKISQLYQADLESLRSKMKNRQAQYNHDRDSLRDIIRELRDKLANEVQLKIQLRTEYENRLNEFKIKYEREHQQLQDLLAMHEKQLQNQSSKISLTHIEHNNVVQQQNLSRKQLMQQNRVLEGQILKKNKQIETLNLRIHSMTGFHQRQIEKLSQQINNLKNQHLRWLDKQRQQVSEWNKQKSQFKQKIQNLNTKIGQVQNLKKINDQANERKIDEKNIKIAQLEGRIQQLQSKCGILHTKTKVEAQNIEKTHLQTQSLMNTQRDRLLQTKDRQIKLKQEQFIKANNSLKNQNDDLKKQNEILRDNVQKSKIRQGELSLQISNLLDSINNRQKLQQHVINIGLSNNYFKNVAQIFKRAIQS